MQPLIFQAIDWVINDIEVKDDNSDDDDLENLSDDSFDNNKKKIKRYLIKIFGRTAKGNSISINILQLQTNSTHILSFQFAQLIAIIIIL